MGDPAAYDGHSDAAGEESRQRSLRSLVVNDLAFVPGSFLGRELASDGAVSDRISGSLHGENHALALHDEHADAHHDRVKDARVTRLGYLPVTRDLAETHQHVCPRDAHLIEGAPAIIFRIVPDLWAEIPSPNPGTQLPSLHISRLCQERLNAIIFSVDD